MDQVSGKNDKTVKFKRIKLSDQIAEDLRRTIAREKMVPGDRLPHEKALMEHYGCAKGTIREALKALEVEGLIAMQSGPNGGPEIQPASLEIAIQQLRQYMHFQTLTFQNVYEVRKSIEVALALSVVGKLTDADYRKLEKNIAICVEANRDGDRAVGRTAETEFHDILCDASDNPLLIFICRFLNSLLRDLVSFRSPSLTEHEQFGDHNVESHIALVEAFKRQDRDAVVHIMKEHMCCAEDFMCRLDAAFNSDLLSRTSG
ncbi:FadR/GntR family transcriptional regulator [Paenochrobactrum sp. BZR 588]|uniref:FadR/GntR family transcriptional regulator n=1 Tax=Paenochrobactrum TaxID=999488 RepID=UPI0035BC40CA